MSFLGFSLGHASCLPGRIHCHRMLFGAFYLSLYAMEYKTIVAGCLH